MNPLSCKHYLRPDSVEELTGMMQNYDQFTLLCGGTDLLVALEPGSTGLSTVIDIKKIAPLKDLKLDSQGLTIGAAVSLAEIARHKALANYPGILDAVKLVGSIQIQNRASIGGNLCNGSPAADTVAILIASEAYCTIISSKGERLVPVQDFILAPGKTALAVDEFLVNIVVPPVAARSAGAYLRLIPRTEMDIAIAGAAVQLSVDKDGVCETAKVAISAVSPRPLLVEQAGDAIVGTEFDDNSLSLLQHAVRDAADPVSDKRASRAYRLHVIGELTRRAVIIARDRARLLKN